MIEYSRHIRLIDSPYFALGAEPFFYGLAYLTFFIFLYKKTKLFTKKQLFFFALGFIIFANLFGRLFFFLFPWKSWEFFLKFFYAQYSVINSLGGIVGVGLFAFIYAKKRKINVWRLFDNLALGAPLMLAIMRIGCFVDGHIKGIETSVPWCITSFSACRHPVAIYYILMNIFVFLVVWNYQKRKHDNGKTLIIFTLTYSFIRMFIDFYFLGSNQMRNVFFCLIIIYSITQLVLYYFKKKK